MKRRILSLLLASVLLASLCGCFGTSSTGLLKKWDCSQPIAARFYYMDENRALTAQELDPARVDALAQTLDAMRCKSHFGHTDYFWAGRFGIELTLSDGSYWSYDGTCMKLHSASVLDEEDGGESLHYDAYVEVTGCDFWDAMAEFFPAVNDVGVSTSW